MISCRQLLPGRSRKPCIAQRFLILNFTHTTQQRNNNAKSNNQARMHILTMSGGQLLSLSIIVWFTSSLVSSTNETRIDYSYDHEFDSDYEISRRFLKLKTKDCTQATPCKQCQGSCQSDDDCKGTNRLCFIRNGDEPIPGCIMEGGIAGQNYCYQRPKMSPDALLTCSAESPCDLCQGNCRFSTDCKEGLQCFHRNKKERVSYRVLPRPNHTDNHTTTTLIR